MLGYRMASSKYSSELDDKELLVSGPLSQPSFRVDLLSPGDISHLVS